MSQSVYFNNDDSILALHKSIYQQSLVVITGMELAQDQFVSEVFAIKYNIRYMFCTSGWENKR